jgi:hypothetical protein
MLSMAYLEYDDYERFGDGRVQWALVKTVTILRIL